MLRGLPWFSSLFLTFEPHIYLIAMSLARFELDAPATSLAEGSWGPPSACRFTDFDRVPFRMFSRSAKVGKVADFGNYLRPMMRAWHARD
jgi:hypothetical protein